jgi:hypothetical protein
LALDLLSNTSPADSDVVMSLLQTTFALLGVTEASFMPFMASLAFATLVASLMLSSSSRILGKRAVQKVLQN